MVVEDPEIPSGTPVIRGTRIPVHDVGAQAEAGVPIKEILDTYPGLSAAQVERTGFDLFQGSSAARHAAAIAYSGRNSISITKKRLHGSL